MYPDRFFRRVTAALAVLTVFASCKENAVIPSNIVPAIDNIKVFGDTLHLNTKTVKDDSVITSLYVSGVSVFVGAGAVNGDQFFGNLRERFYFQVRPPQDNYLFDQSKYQIDSAILILPYSGFSYGDTSNTAGNVQFSAYRVQEDFYADTSYYSFHNDFAVGGSPIATLNVSLPQLIRSAYDSTTVGSVKHAPHLRMKLTDDIMNELINKTGTADYTNTTTFLAMFKGIQVTTDNSGKTLPFFLLNGIDQYSTASILMYYHTKNSGGFINDTLTIAYPFDGDNCGYFNKIERDYGAPVQALFNSAAPSDNTIAINNSPGASAEITVTDFNRLPRCIVNQATLTITQISSPMDGVFAPPPRIYPKGVDATGATYTIADRYPLTDVNALAFIDGNIRIANLGGMIVNQYVLNIPRELERAIADQKKELRLRIGGTQSFPGANRVTAGGSTNSRPLYKATLNIV